MAAWTGFIQMMLISAESADGDDLSLFVTARTADKAIELWRAYYELAPDEFPRRIWKAPTSIGATERALDWYSEGSEVTILWPVAEGGA